jgi:putative Holliday junction resolvase
MRVLGIDYGRKRLGLALSDEDEILASPLATWRRARSVQTDFANLSRLAREHGVVRVVVGLPLHMDGTAGEMAREATAFAQGLARESQLPVETFDERLSSSEAERAMLEGDLSRRQRKENRDMLAAVLILQGFLSRAADS